MGFLWAPSLGKASKTALATPPPVGVAIINEVRGINRVVLDISSKPPATIEWE